MKCPVCQEEMEPKLVETYVDPIDGYEYKIYLCPACEVQFSDPMKNPGPDFYEKFNELYGGGESKTDTISNFRINSLKRILQDKKKERLNLLDLGCGYGDFLQAAKNLGCKVCGIDFDKEKLSVAAKKVGQENVKQKSFEEFFIENNGNKFDIIVFFEVLEHTENPSEFIRSVRNILYSDGYIMLDVPNANRILQRASGIVDYPPHHFTRWKIKSLFNFLEKNGFRIVTTTTIYPLKHFYESLFILFSINLIALLKKILFPHKSISQLRTQPLDRYFSSKEDVIKTILLSKRNRQKIIMCLKYIYYIFFVPFTILFVYPLIKYLRNKDKGGFIFAVAQRK